VYLIWVAFLTEGRRTVKELIIGAPGWDLNSVPPDYEAEVESTCLYRPVCPDGKEVWCSLWNLKFPVAMLSRSSPTEPHLCYVSPLHNCSLRSNFNCFPLTMLCLQKHRWLIQCMFLSRATWRAHLILHYLIILIMFGEMCVMALLNMSSFSSGAKWISYDKLWYAELRVWA
jgi:hypothetical protein